MANVYLFYNSMYLNDSHNDLIKEIEFLETRLMKLRTIINKARLCPDYSSNLAVLEDNYNDASLRLNAAQNALWLNETPKNSCIVSSR